MTYIFQSNAELYNKVAGEFKGQKDLEKNIQETVKEIRDTREALDKMYTDSKGSTKQTIESLENLALKCGYKKLGTFYNSQTFFQTKGENCGIFSWREKFTYCEELERFSSRLDMAYVDEVPRKDLNKAAKSQATRMTDMARLDFSYLDMAYILTTGLTGAGAGIYFPLTSPELLSTTEMGVLASCAGILGGISGLLCGTMTYIAKELIMSPLRKRKANKFLKQYEDKGLITHGEEALERLIGG